MFFQAKMVFHAKRKKKPKQVRTQLCAGLFSRESRGADIDWQSYNMQASNGGTQNNKMMA